MLTERILGIDFGTSTSLIKVKTYKDGRPIDARDSSDYVRFDGAYSSVPTMLCHDPSYDEYHIGHQAAANSNQGELFQNFKMGLVSEDEEERKKAEELVHKFFTHLYEMYDNQRSSFPTCDSETTFVSYPAKWSASVAKTMEKIAVDVGFLDVYGIDEPSVAIHAVMIQRGDILEKLGGGDIAESQPCSSCGRELEPDMMFCDKCGVKKSADTTSATSSHNVLIIDMGAGTTDLALCHYTAGEKEIEILKTYPEENGVFFGGREIDTALWEYIKKYLADCGLPNINNEMQYIPACKKWKEANVSPSLNKNRAQNNCGFIAPMLAFAGEPKPFPAIGRSVFEDILSDYIRQFPELINGLFENLSDIKPKDVDLVILTGGHSQWYFVDEIINGYMTKFGAVNLPKIQTEPWRLVKLALPQETVGFGMVYQPMAEKAILKSEEVLHAEMPFDVSVDSTVQKYDLALTNNQLAVAPTVIPIAPTGDIYTFTGSKDMKGLITIVNTFLNITKDMETQVIEGDDGVAIQARSKGGTWKQLIGMDKALTVKFTPLGENQISVNMSAAKWLDKAGAMAMA